MMATALGPRNVLDHDYVTSAPTLLVMAATSPQDPRHAHDS
jgi:hypothetical protein